METAARLGHSVLPYHAEGRFATDNCDSDVGHITYQ